MASVATEDWRTNNYTLSLAQEIVNMSVYNSLSFSNVTGNMSQDVTDSEGKMAATNNSLFIKIVLLLILTAVVLLSTYKFVVRLFSGYTEKKDDSSDYYIGMQESL